MKFHELSLSGAYVIDLEPIADHRGFNARAFCQREFRDAGLPTTIAQVNVIHNGPAGTLRGFHYQIPPHAEAKLFRVTRGAIFDVVVDLRPESPTYQHHEWVELRADEYHMLFVPERFGQAFQTLEDDTELTYQTTAFYAPQDGRGFRWNDPEIGVDWPLEVAAISEKDRTWPDLDWDAVERQLTLPTADNDARGHA